ncbi:MAG TPA: UDP-glucose 4-epimerase GalE [Mycobacteriales bacterium]|nr:UDP-glucose 4-epimerase GalE [Mycobacteriales bacterium]
MSSWLVTGGAGYIGSHIVKALRDRSEPVVVIDDLSTGTADRVGDATLVRGSVLDADLVAATIRDYDVGGIIHVAARKQVGESVERPLFYYRENVVGTLNLLEAAVAAGVQSFVFSSSCSTYGMPDVDQVTEDTPFAPMSPYGETKVVGEWMSRATAVNSDLRVISLRYFNVAGARSPEFGDPAVLNLIPMALKALTNGEAPKIFGDDYPTPDGTCIRDYVHVADIADAHVAALEHLNNGGGSATYNIGRGEGSSVREVLAMVADITGIRTEPVVVPRRPGDPARIIANVDRIQADLGWTSRYGLQGIIESAWSAWPHEATT